MHAWEIKTGRDGMGLRWAKASGYRVTAYAEGGYSCSRYVGRVGWCLFSPGKSMPEAIEMALCRALGIEYVS